MNSIVCARLVGQLSELYGNWK